MSAKPQESISGGGCTGKKLSLGILYRTIMLENVSVDVVDGARVKGVLGVSVRPRWQGKGLRIDKKRDGHFRS
jgi:hypothetical protein